MSIIPIDKRVYIDGVSYENIDMDWIPQMNGSDVHAVQWDEDHGEIELVTADPNIEIKDLGIFKKAIKLWQQKHEEFLKFEEERIRREKEIEEDQKRMMESQYIEVSDEMEDLYSDLEDLYSDLEELLLEEI